MRRDLADERWDGPERGELTGPDGRRYVRRGTRAKRRDVEQLIDAGTPSRTERRLGRGRGGVSCRECRP